MYSLIHLQIYIIKCITNNIKWFGHFQWNMPLSSHMLISVQVHAKPDERCDFKSVPVAAKGGCWEEEVSGSAVKEVHEWWMAVWAAHSTSTVALTAEKACTQHK